MSKGKKRNNKYKRAILNISTHPNAVDNNDNAQTGIVPSIGSEENGAEQVSVCKAPQVQIPDIRASLSDL